MTHEEDVFHQLCASAASKARWFSGRASFRGGRRWALLEAHLLDVDGDLYGREVVVKVEHKVAEDVRLDSLDALARKIASDVAAVRAFFAAA
jgi:FAD synthase